MQTRSAFQPNRAALAAGQRRLNKKAAQLSSSENDFWNSASDRALAISVRPRDRANPIAQILHLGEPESTGQASAILAAAIGKSISIFTCTESPARTVA